MQALHRHFTRSPGAEYSIEIDPRTVSPGGMSFLADLGIDEAQGYLMAKPMPPTEFAALLRAGLTGLPLARTA